MKVNAESEFEEMSMAAECALKDLKCGCNTVSSF